MINQQLVEVFLITYLQESSDMSPPHLPAAREIQAQEHIPGPPLALWDLLQGASGFPWSRPATV